MKARENKAINETMSLGRCDARTSRTIDETQHTEARENITSPQKVNVISDRERHMTDASEGGWRAT